MHVCEITQIIEIAGHQFCMFSIGFIKFLSFNKNEQHQLHIFHVFLFKYKCKYIRKWIYIIYFSCISFIFDRHPLINLSEKFIFVPIGKFVNFTLSRANKSRTKLVQNNLQTRLKGVIEDYTWGYHRKFLEFLLSWVPNVIFSNR